MSTQTMRVSKGLLKIIQGGGSDYLNYSQIRKIKEATYPGRFHTSAGETAGNPVALAVAGDEDTGTVELLLYRVGAIPQDIDTSIATSSYGMFLGRNGHRFEVACWRADENSAILKGQAMALEASGMLKVVAYADGTEATDFHLFQFVLSRDSSDISSTDPVIFGRF